VLGLTGVLVTLVVLTIVLAGVFLVRPSITAGVTGKILAFIGLCVLPALCIGTGMSFHMRRSQQTAYCISCHSMESHGQSLYVLDQNYIPAQHFQNHLVPPDEACYTCHTDYTMYGPVKDKLKGLRYLYLEYVSTPPKTIHLDGQYSNLQCLHCHAGTRDFEANLNHMAPIASLETNQLSCISSGCHATIHNASEVGHLKMWTEGTASTSVAAEAAPAAAEPAATAGPSKAPTGNSASAATAARGKSIYDSQGCSGCHGESGRGGSGPALTHTSSQYRPAQLTAVLKAPTAQMKAAGMAPLSVNAADMEALVSYVSSLGGTSVVSAGTLPPSRLSSPASAKAQPGAEPGPPQNASAVASPAAGSSLAAGTSKAPTGSSASAANAARGKSIYDSQGCSGCHGESGRGGSGPALTHTSSQYPPAQLTAVLKAPTAQMKASGMAPLTVNAADMEDLVSYVSSLGGTSAASAGTPPAAGSSSPGAAAAGTAAAAGPSKAPTGNSASAANAARGKSIYDSQGCSGCHGESGRGGSGPALTHTSSQYPPAQLTAVLKAPTAQMKAAGMAPLSVSAADMEALVSYVSSLGGTSAASAGTPPAAGSSSPGPAAAGTETAAAPSKPEPKKKSILRRLFAPGGGPIF
jgi:cytochrome c-type protein NapC